MHKTALYSLFWPLSRPGRPAPKHKTVVWPLLSFLFAADPLAADDPALRRAPEIVGQLEDSRLVEVSGLAASGRSGAVLWLLNDGGASPSLHAVDRRGGAVDEIALSPARNRDWEDLAAFELDGEPQLLAADIGDNGAQHAESVLYIVPEPAVGETADTRSIVPRTVRFRYPDGPRDAESLAVDVAERKAYVLSKRDIPPRLYTVPLDASGDAPIVAELLGPITSLPAPTAEDIRLAPIRKDWHWQPTAMDFSRDGRLAAILTYHYVFLFEREPDQDWYTALNRTPRRISIRPVRGAESLGFSADGRSLYLTVEQRHAPLFRIDLERTTTRGSRQ